MTTSRSLRRRLEKLAGPPVPASRPATNEALLTLRKVTVDLCGAGREGWITRCATDRATPADMAVLDALPDDALMAAGVSAVEYTQLMHRVLNAY